MPFVMDQDVASQNLKEDGKHATEAATPSQNTAVHTNGVAKPHSNGLIPNGVSAGTTQSGLLNGHMALVQESARPKDTPPLEGAWRSGMTNKSMGTMLYRLSQSCFRDLNETLTKMAQQPIQHSNGQTNGDRPNARDTSEVSLEKKNTLMTFASDQRDRFIKALVLSDWARNAEDMAGLIDVLEWQRRQDANQMAGVDNIGYIKRELGATKMPNPNIAGAMELLGTGKANSKTPDLGYLPPKPLTAKQLLRTLQDMNVVLATRLNLHEDLPEQFRNFSIADGRATFRVSGEFEVDLSVADEDNSTQFYFVDLAFLFQPAPNVLDEQTRYLLESRTNAELGSKGLQGAFDFLHNFVLTHKINVLRDQFRKLLQEKWFDCARAETKGRVLMIQYWLGRQGRKSWVEFGVTTGRRPKSQAERPHTARLSVRWFRNGDLVENAAIDIDWEDIDLERIMSGIVAQHVSWSLRSTCERLTIGSGKISNLETQLSTSHTRPSECNLRLSLLHSQSSLKLRIEPISGRFSITPATKRSADIERRLNSDSDADANLPQAMSALLCRMAQDRVDKARQLVGWAVSANTFRPENLRAQFGDEYQTLRAYVCNKAWGQQWGLIATFSLSGDKWWIARTQERAAQIGAPNAREVIEARQLAVGDLLAMNSVVSRSSLLRIEELAVAEVSFAVLSKQLSSMGIQYRSEKTAPLTSRDNPVNPTSDSSFGLFFRGSAILKGSCGKALAVDCVRLTHHGMRIEQSEGQDVAELSHEIRLTVDGGKFKHLRKHLSKQNREGDIAMNESGVLALRLRAPFGEPYMEQVVLRIQSCDRLDAYLAVVEKRNYTPNVVQLNKIAFTYFAARDLSVAIVFNGRDCTLPARLDLKPVGSNPHQRIRVMLEQMLNDPRKTDQLGLVATVLDFSLQAMLAFEKIESVDAGKRNASVHLRGPLHYILTYTAPLPVVKIDMDVRHTSSGDRKDVSWSVRCAKNRQELLKSAFGKAWLAFVDQKAALWSSPGDGSVIAKPSGMKDLILQLDQIVRRFRPEDAVAKQETNHTADAKPQVSQQKPPAPVKQPPQRPSAPQQKSAQQQQPAQHRPNQPAPTVNMMPNTGRSNQAKPKKEIIELD